MYEIIANSFSEFVIIFNSDTVYEELFTGTFNECEDFLNELLGK